MYIILGTDQQEYGPFDQEGIRRCIAEGRANGESLVRTEPGADWKPLAKLPEFRDALAAPRLVPPAPAPPSATPAAAPLDSALARTSLILGLVSIACLPILTGIPAIICGHIARNRIRLAPFRYGGSNMVLTGLILGYVTTCLTVLVLPAMLLPALAKAKANAQRINCVSNLKQVGLAARIYAATHENTFPTNFTAMKEDLMSPHALVCSADSSHTRAANWDNFNETENVSYEFLLPGVKESDALGKVVFRCPIHGNEAYGDGSVQRGRRGR